MRRIRREQYVTFSEVHRLSRMICCDHWDQGTGTTGEASWDMQEGIRSKIPAVRVRRALQHGENIPKPDQGFLVVLWLKRRLWDQGAHT